MIKFFKKLKNTKITEKINEIYKSICFNTDYDKFE